MLKRVLPILFCIILVTVSSIIAQDNEADFDPDAIPNFGRILLEIDIPMEDNDFLFAKHLAVQPDLSRIYVGSIAAGIVLVLDDKGDVIDQVDIFYEAPVTDMAVGADGNLYVIQFGNLYAYDRDGRLIDQLAGDFSADISFDRVVPAPDKSIFLLDVFSDKDRLYHMTEDGEDILVSDWGYLSSITGKEQSIFDEFKLGQDGFLYYFSDEAKQMLQMDESFEVLNTYNNLPADQTGTQSSAMLIDDEGRVLFGNTGAVEIYGAKEELVHTIELKSELEFVFDIAFAENGQLLILQNTKLTIIQYGEREDT